jgi:hypothetical protein
MELVVDFGRSLMPDHHSRTLRYRPMHLLGSESSRNPLSEPI